MSSSSHNHDQFATKYAELGIENTYYLAFRDLPAIVSKHCNGNNALDHGCGAGRSTRLLKSLGLSVVGVDTNASMIEEAKNQDPAGRYEFLNGAALPFADASFDLVLQSIVVMEIPNRGLMDEVFSEIKRVLKENGIAIVVTHNAENCLGEWSSFIWKTIGDAPIKSGDQAEVMIRGTDITFRDYMWFHHDLEESFNRSGLLINLRHQPMPAGDEPYKWYQELELPYWDIYVLKVMSHP